MPLNNEVNASDDGSKRPVSEASKADAGAPKLRSGVPPDNGSKEPLVLATVTLTDNDNSCKSKIGLVQLVSALLETLTDRQPLFKVCMTDFFLFARSNLPNLLISTAKKFFHSDFPFPCFEVPKASNFTFGEVQNRETKNWGLGMIVTPIQDSKPHEKQISLTFSYFLINNALLYHFLAN